MCKDHFDKILTYLIPGVNFVHFIFFLDFNLAKYVQTIMETVIEIGAV